MATLALTALSINNTLRRWKRSTIAPATIEKTTWPAPSASANMPTQNAESSDSSSTSQPWTPMRTFMSTAANVL